jgi:hypothetical protein
MLFLQLLIDVFLKRFVILLKYLPNTKTMVSFLADCRQKYLNTEGKVDWSKVEVRWAELKKGKVSLANKFWNAGVS